MSPAPLSGHTSPEHLRILRSLTPSVYVPSLLEVAGRAALFPVLPLIALKIGFSVPEAAGIAIVFGLAEFLGPIPCGMLIRRIGERPALLTTGVIVALVSALAGAGMSAAITAGGSAGSRWALIVALVAIALCTQVWNLGRQAYLGGALPPALRARGMSLFGGTVRIGGVVGPGLGAAVIALGHISWVFYLNALLCLIATIMVGVFLPEGEASGRRRSWPVGVQERMEKSTQKMGADGASPQKLGRSSARRLLSRAVLGRMMLVWAGTAQIVIARRNLPVILPLLGDFLGLDAVWISLAFAVGAVIEIALVLPAGTLMETRGRVAVAVPCGVVIGLGYLLMATLAVSIGGLGMAGAVTTVMLGSILISLGNGFGAGIMMTLGLDLSPVHERPRYLAWWHTLLGAAGLAGPAMVSAITVFFPLTVAAAATGVLSLGGGLWLARVLPRLGLGVKRPQGEASGSE